MARARDRKTLNLRPLLPKTQHSVTGQADGIHVWKGDCMPPQSQSLGSTASQIEASIVHNGLGATELPRHLYTDPNAGTLSVVSENPFILSGSLLCQDPQPPSSALPRGEGPEGSVVCILPPSCDAHQPSGSEHDVNDWVKKQGESFPGRLYNKPAGETPRPAGLHTDEPASQKLENGDRDSPGLPTFFQDEMAMREYQRSSISSKSECPIDSRIPDNSDLARSSHDPVAHAVLLPPLPCGLPELRPGLDRMSSPVRKNPLVPESTTGQSSTRPSVWDESSLASSLASSSLPRTSIYGSTPSIASSRARHQCEECDRVFKLGKDLKRHIQSAHVDNPESYMCRCSYHTTRKDVIKRHIGSSAKGCASARPDAVDVCICKRFKTPNVLCFLEHIKDCNKKPRGRPKKKKEI
ncbi:unnamed protein product [Clonostachys solani]|uniref:C2H2-type domain-containing protein n=1 Tax=Clonostachys solani TaxID=160281 RepID=A0A9N9Z1C7_9HYPO|nr:unnamed protein product [Clonostachys solani]